MVHPIGKYRYNVQWRVVGSLKMKKNILLILIPSFFFLRSTYLKLLQINVMPCFNLNNSNFNSVKQHEVVSDILKELK